MNFNANEVKTAIIEWIQKFFKENGCGCKAVIGISGGKDSTIVAALCVEALGKERVLGVLMPNGKQKDIDDAKKVVNHLGIKYINVNIFNAVREIKHKVKFGLDDHWSEQSSINLPARIRMAILYAVSQTVNGRVANTCNLSENWVGYSTRWGDNVGDFSPLSNLTVTEVKKIGYALGLPKEFIEKIPSDGLCDKTDEDNLGFSYKVLDEYIRSGVIENEQLKEKIDQMHEKNLFKLQMIPSFSFGYGER